VASKKKAEELTVKNDTINEIANATDNYANGIGTIPVLAGTSESQLKAGVDKHTRRIASGEYGLDNLLLEELYSGLVLASSNPADARGHIVNAAAIAAVIVDSIDAQLEGELADHNEAVEELEFDPIDESTDDDEAPVEPTEEEIAAAADAFSDLAE
jgi:hypothetical protein